MSVSGSDRLHGLDAVRGFALLLGVVFHAAASFTPGLPWMIVDNQPSETLGWIFYVSHVFRMSAFFLIAGFFAHMSFHRLGAKAFIRDRAKRIGLPLVVGWIVLFPLTMAAIIWAVYVTNGGSLPKGPPPAMPGPAPFPLTHLWFLYVLILLYVAALAVRGMVALVDRGGDIRRAADKVVEILVRNPLGMVVLAAPLAVAFYAQPNWLMALGIPTPDQSLIPNIPAAVGFGTAFGFGWLLHRQVGLIRLWEGRWMMNLVLALALSVGGRLLLTKEAGLSPEMLKLAGAACYTLAIWSWIFAFIGLALRFMSGFSPVRRYIADASYWIYLIHLPLVIALQVAVSRLDWHWAVKFAVIMGVAFPLMFASYHLLVRRSFIGAILNGRKAPRPEKPSAQPLAQPQQDPA